jgi:hypothetical protein
MHTIFIIDDYSSNAENAAVLAFRLAKNARAKIVLGTLKSLVREPAARMLVGAEGIAELPLMRKQGLMTYLNALNENDENCGCNIEELEISNMTTDSLAGFINQNQTLMVIKPIAVGNENRQRAKVAFNIRVLLSKVFTPVCLIPTGWQVRSLKRITYITDLRYCRTDILNHLFKFISQEANVYIAHMALPGVADLVPDFAKGLFNTLTARYFNGQRLSFHHIKETASMTVADVLVNSMNNDALILTNRSAHFNQLIGDDFDIKHPELIEVPLLVYPA